MIRFLVAIALLAFTVYCVVDVVRTDKERVRHLPKLAWVTVTMLFTPFGGLAWLFAGRPGGLRQRGGGQPRGPRGPDDDPDFLRGI
ncbi:MAG TPA: PLDc N-terminal domain-containing protein [Ornithinimicrobium sp.]|uniref:PLDc N-terminal domain-containing protein n=1 Tax=Ornithinimicrobium sp. TaxID=1977084 RepID=UPI002B45B733|nr:PLDc N-terminal domain-containing protein [Ornithinimicrobium sp.]HKJ10760.1 PLDc N-terminal domain-containing protein [Ornithinimicrobium sp.]